MLYAVSPFGMSRIKRTQVRAAFCFSFFCFFPFNTCKSKHRSVFFIIRYTYRLRAKCQPFTHAKNTRTQKDNSILRYSPRAVKPRAVSLCTEFGHTAEVLFPYSPVFCVLYAGFQKTAAVFFHFVRKTLVRGLYFLLFQKNFDFLEFPY